MPSGFEPSSEMIAVLGPGRLRTQRSRVLSGTLLSASFDLPGLAQLKNEIGSAKAALFHRLLVLGDFEGHTSIQRSPPRWVAPKFIQSAAEFIFALR